MIALCETVLAGTTLGCVVLGITGRKSTGDRLKLSGMAGDDKRIVVAGHWYNLSQGQPTGSRDVEK